MTPDPRSSSGPSSLLLLVLAVASVALFGADFVYHRHGYLEIEETPGFYVLMGLGAALAVLVAGAGLRALLGRPEDYYAPHDTAAEPLPAADRAEGERTDG